MGKWTLTYNDELRIAHMRSQETGKRIAFGHYRSLEEAEEVARGLGLQYVVDRSASPYRGPA